eukprot:m.526614 g.526614  ORF g.526614 m.526614 type:complete len:696 (-) comp57551_c0_seq4:962-3049(-)
MEFASSLMLLVLGGIIGAVCCLLLQVGLVRAILLLSDPPRNAFQHTPPRLHPDLDTFLKSHPRPLEDHQRDELPTETCNALNLLLHFIFANIRDTPPVRKWFMKMLNKDFQDIKKTSAINTMLERITVRDYSLGSSIPLISNVTLVRPKTGEIGDKELDILAQVSYKGQFQIKIDADLVFGMQATISVSFLEMDGRVRIAFRKQPQPHFWVSFVQDPILKFDVESVFQGKSIAQLNSLLANQIRRTIRKKHTLPGFKIRYDPLFPKPQTAVEVKPKLRGKPLQIGRLRVRVIAAYDLQRVRSVTKGALAFCMLSLKNSEDIDQVHRAQASERSFTVFEVELPKAGPGGSLGFQFHPVSKENQEQCRVDEIDPGGPAHFSALQKDDIVTAINGVAVISVKQAIRIIKQTTDRVILSVKREERAPPPNPKAEPEDRTSRTTSKVSLTESPKWNQTLEFDVEAGDETLYVRLYECGDDSRGQKAGRTFLIGYAEIPLRSVSMAVASTGKPHISAYPLSTSRSGGLEIGEIELEFFYSSTESARSTRATTATTAPASTPRHQHDDDTRSTGSGNARAPAPSISEEPYEVINFLDGSELFRDMPPLERQRHLADLVQTSQTLVDLEEETKIDLERQLEEALNAGDSETVDNIRANLAASEERMSIVWPRLVRCFDAQRVCEEELQRLPRKPSTSLFSSMN